MSFSTAWPTASPTTPPTMPPSGPPARAPAQPPSTGTTPSTARASNTCRLDCSAITVVLCRGGKFPNLPIEPWRIGKLGNLPPRSGLLARLAGHLSALHEIQEALRVGRVKFQLAGDADAVA